MATERNIPDSLRAGWEARLELEFATLASRTVLARRSSVGPLVVQRPFYPEGDVCHVYLVHPPGGVVGGDVLELTVLGKSGSHSLITTPAATKFYRSDGRVAQQRQVITMDAGANVEWLPQETIVFPDAQARITTCVKLSEQSRFIGWEIACYGRPASGLAFGGGHVAQDFELWVNDAPLVLDHLRLAGTSESMSAPFGLASHPVLGTIFAYPGNDEVLKSAREVMDEGLAARAAKSDAPLAITSACSLVDGALVCRAVGAQADAVRALFMSIWQRVRPGMMGRAAVAPRIWAT